MYNFISFLADIPGPFDYEPNSETIIDLGPYIAGALILIAIVTVMVIILSKRKKKTAKKDKTEQAHR